jgi:hypothetical protein
VYDDTANPIIARTRDQILTAAHSGHALDFVIMTPVPNARSS